MAVNGEYISRKRLIETIGLSNAAKLVREHGGLRFRVPSREDAGFIELGRLVGYSAASMLAAAFGGQRIMLPVRAQPKEVKLRARVLELWQAGMKVDEIAAKLRMHTRYAYRLLAEAEEESSAGAANTSGAGAARSE